MKFSIDRAIFLKVLGHVQSVVERRGTIPILSNIRVDAKGGKLSLTATDMDIAVVDSTEAQIDEEGSTTIPAHTLYDIIRKLPDSANVSMEQEKEGKIAIKAGSSRFLISSLPVDDFPVMAEGELPFSFTLKGKECQALIDKTRFAISTEETRYYLNGVYLHVANHDGSSVLRAVATDGHRLARIEVPVPDGAADMPAIIIPRKTINELSKLIEGADEVKISLSDSKVRFECGNATLVSKLIDGTFPDYERVIPHGNDKILELDSKAFANAVDRVSVIASEKSRGIKLDINTGRVAMSASSAEQGNASEELEVNYGAEPVEIGFNARYLIEVMQQIEGDTAQFVLSESASPALVRDPADVGALYVVMPMRV